jgi:hypothetical protein
MKLLNFRVINEEKLYGSVHLDEQKFRWVGFSIYRFNIRLEFQASPLQKGYGYIANVGERRRVNCWLDCQKELVDKLFESLEENEEQNGDE